MGGPDHRVKEDDPHRVELIVMMTQVVEDLQFCKEKRDTLISLREAVQKLDALLERGSW